jgi:hypothetical protein
VSENPTQEGKACAVSIEVDGRQRYIFETDKLQEMLGASLLIAETLDQAAGRLRESEGFFVFAPVSGEIRAWCRAEQRSQLLTRVWELRRWLHERGIEHTVAYLDLDDDGAFTMAEPATRLAAVHEQLGWRMRRLKDAKPGAVATPRSSLFATCEIHALDPANRWKPNGRGGEDEPRRELRGFRAAAKLAAWSEGRNRFRHDTLWQPILTRLSELSGQSAELSALLADLRRLPIAERLDDLATHVEGERGQDQFIAFLYADGDEMGRLISSLDWNDAAWGDGRAPWQRNAAFAANLNRCVREALTEAIAEAVAPDVASALALVERITLDQRYRIPILPQLQGGEDIWLIAARELALPVAARFAANYARKVADDAVIARACRVAEARASAHERSAGRLTISIGIAFAKAGYPVHAMVDAAEKLLKSAKRLRKARHALRQLPAGGALEGCVDWYWIESSLSESIEHARRESSAYRDDTTSMYLTTRPWTASEAEACTEAARRLHHLPRRKREHLETLLRLGYPLSLLAWESWWANLGTGERDLFRSVNEALPPTLRLDRPDADPWLPERRVGEETVRMSPLLDLLALQHAHGWEGAAGDPATDEVIP